MSRTLVLSFALLFISACSAQTPVEHGDDAARVAELREGDYQQFESDEPFRQLGLLVDSPTRHFEYRVAGADWQPVEITWSEDVHHVGRVILDEPATSIELRADRPWIFGQAQLFDEVHAPDVLTRDLPFAEPEPALPNALAPAELVISRAEWGARNPNKVCGSPHNPYRMAIHHTASPSDDGGDAAARMRQMQAYHIDSNGWCDIGYHFVVSQAGDIYQGRSTEERTGAHVGGQNTGNVGVSLIGNFQQQNVSATQFNAAAEIVGWVATTYDIPFDRQSIKGHREHAGQSTSCPGDNLLSRLQELIDTAKNGPVPDGGHESQFQVRWLDEPADFYQSGSSSGKPDLLPGDTIRAELAIENTTPGPMRDVLLDYWFEAPHLAATNYVIESDAPAFDGSTWSVNDSDSNPANPAKDDMGPNGTLDLYAMASGETKRIVVDLEARQYSLGMADHPDVRGWVHQVENLYGVQSDFNMEPSNTNTFSELLQGFAQLDVLSPHEWQFDAGEPEQLEGWTGCADVAPSVDIESGALTAEFDAMDCVESPAWTAIDADTWDQLVLRMSVPASSEMVVYWGGEGETLTEERAVTFDVSPEQSTYVVPLGEHKAWSGSVERLRLTPLVDAAGTVSIDAIFVQSSDGTVGSAREDYDDTPPVAVLDDGVPKPEVDPDAGDDVDPDGPVGERANWDSEDVRTNSGCSTTNNTPSPFGLLVLLFLFVRRRR